MSDHKTLTINMAPEAHEELTSLADQRGITITELVRRALALDKYCWEHREDELLVADDDHVRQIVMF